MSPRPRTSLPNKAAVTALARLAGAAAAQLSSARHARRWSLADLAARAGVSISSAQAAEAGRPMSLDTYTRLATALSLRPSLVFESGRAAAHVSTRDAVHAAMGEFEAARLTRHGLAVAIDEPYQHFQFAGRADLLAWTVEERRLLHIENKSRLDDIQDVAGAYNAKRAYLAGVLADRLGLGPRGWRTVTHVIAALWSSEVLHVLRLRTATFQAICPNPPEAFAAWWSGNRPPEGVTSSLVILDPDPAGSPRRRPWIGLDELDAARPRYRGYAAAAEALSGR